MQTVSNKSDWLAIRRDQETAIESVHAHFQGHAYDAHDHDEMLVGVTLQGVQRFTCRRSLHTSFTSRSILLEPGAVHHGHAPEPGGFTYAMRYLPPAWVNGMTHRLGLGDVSTLQAAFRHTLVDDTLLGADKQRAFLAIHHNEGRLARDQGLDRLPTRATWGCGSAAPTGSRPPHISGSAQPFQTEATPATNMALPICKESSMFDTKAALIIATTPPAAQCSTLVHERDAVSGGEA